METGICSRRELSPGSDATSPPCSQIFEVSRSEDVGFVNIQVKYAALVNAKKKKKDQKSQTKHWGFSNPPKSALELQKLNKRLSGFAYTYVAAL